MSAAAEVAVFGGGGHAKVVIATLVAAGRMPAVVYDDDPAKWGQTLLGVRVASSAEAHERQPARAVIAIGSNAVRARLASQYPQTEWVSVVHPRATVHESVVLGAGTVVFAGAVIQPDTRIGQHVIVNTAATIDHDCVIGDYVHLAPGTHLAGGVRIGSSSFLGIGAVAIPGAEIAAGVTLGAGAVVTRSIAAAGTYVGAPARSLGKR